VQRGLAVKAADRWNTAVMLLQAPLVGLLIAAVLLLVAAGQAVCLAVIVAWSCAVQSPWWPRCPRRAAGVVAAPGAMIEQQAIHARDSLGNRLRKTIEPLLSVRFRNVA
jgi:hypothetical protein